MFIREKPKMKGVLSQDWLNVVSGFSSPGQKTWRTSLVRMGQAKSGRQSCCPVGIKIVDGRIQRIAWLNSTESYAERIIHAYSIHLSPNPDKTLIFTLTLSLY